MVTSYAQLFSVACIKPLTPVLSASHCALIVLLRDSLNYCNKCFSSGGGLEICESWSIKARKGTAPDAFFYDKKSCPLFLYRV